MTREEAIKHFESYIGNECYTDYHQEACRMAISALRFQTGTTLNDPLTLEQIRKIDFGKDPPIYVISSERWAGTFCTEGYSEVDFRGEGEVEIWIIGWDIPMKIKESDYGRTWIAYRRKPDAPLDREDDT